MVSSRLYFVFSWIFFRKTNKIIFLSVSDWIQSNLNIKLQGKNSVIIDLISLILAMHDFLLDILWKDIFNIFQN